MNEVDIIITMRPGALLLLLLGAGQATSLKVASPCSACSCIAEELQTRIDKEPVSKGRTSAGCQVFARVCVCTHASTHALRHRRVCESFPLEVQCTHMLFIGTVPNPWYRAQKPQTRC